MKQDPVLYFDGVCGLCNEYVDFVMKRDQKRKFLFSPLQSEYAKFHLPRELTQNPGSLVLFHRQRLYTKSNAVLEICKILGGLWAWALIAYILPQVLRDWVYDFIAARRYKWFGLKQTCRLPSAEERDRFLL